MPLAIEELGLSGYATIQTVEDCGPIARGDGSVVTGRFSTSRVNVIIRLTVAGPDGTTEILEGTTVHPIWSVDRNEWIQLSDLQEGERLQAANGIATVVSIAIVSTSVPVYNIEVHGERVYQVGELGLLVHNAYPGDLGAAIGRGMKTISGPTMADDAVEIAAKLGKPMTMQEIREIVHIAKNKMNIGAAEDLVLDLSGGMWDSRTGEFIG
jgi:hypothetical protein